MRFSPPQSSGVTTEALRDCVIDK